LDITPYLLKFILTIFQEKINAGEKTNNYALLSGILKTG